MARANVRGSLNVIRFTTENAEALGEGDAGGKETATAVLSDLLHVLGR